MSQSAGSPPLTSLNSDATTTPIPSNVNSNTTTEWDGTSTSTDTGTTATLAPVQDPANLDMDNALPITVESPFDPSRSSTPHTNANSPIAAGSQEGTNRSTSNASERSSLIGQKHLPILSLPALPGQRLCTCMRAVEEANKNTLIPTNSSTTSISQPPPASPPPALDRYLSLQDRFWLSVGEVALHNDLALHDHQVERGVDSMETLAVKLTHISQQLTHTRQFLRDEQLRGVESIMIELEKKNSELVEYLKQTRLEEQEVRDRIDALSIKVEKAKKTVTMGGTLGLATAKQQREQAHLDNVRSLRDQAQKQLETIVTNRTLSQNQMLNVSTIAAECRITDMDRRDYKLMYKQVQSSFFHRSFGSAYQSQCDTMVKVLSKFRDQAHECIRRQKIIQQTIQELRGRISLVVAAYWK